MSGAFQTPFPTASSRSQAFILKTTRPGPEGPLSPVPQVEKQKAAVKRVYTRRNAARKSSSSRNLKENAPHSRNSGPSLRSEDAAPNLRTKLRARRTTSFASLKDRQKEKTSKKVRRSVDRPLSQGSLASPFSSRPPSPTKTAALVGSDVSQSVSKRALVDSAHAHELSLPVSKRRHSAAPSPVNLALRNQAFPLPSPIPFRISPSPQIELQRRTSHPALGMESQGGSRFGLQSSLASVNFNRPPSQLSIYAPTEGEDGDFWSQPPTGGMVRAGSWTYNNLFEEELGFASTPYHSNRAAHGGPTRLGEPGLLASPEIKESVKIGIPRRASFGDLTQNMSLTSVKEGSKNSAADRSPWITDSLISPPTIYALQRPEETEDAPHPRQPEHEEVAEESATLSESDGNALARTRDAATKEAETGVEKVIVGQFAGRSRSGTILGPAPVIAGRGRTGTITAAPATVTNKQNRERSGTITPRTAQAHIPAAQAGRTRSGTIIALRPKPQNLKTAASVPDPRSTKVPHAVEDILDPHVDAQYDPIPDLEMAFSSAPNPDLDIEAESDDEEAYFKSSHRPTSPKTSNSISAKKLFLLLSPLGDPLNLASPTTVAAAGSATTNKRSKRQSLKMALGLNPKGYDASGNCKDSKPTASGLVLEAITSTSRTLCLETPSSSDPLDLLSHFDEQEFNKPYEAKTKGRTLRGKGTTVRWDKG